MAASGPLVGVKVVEMAGHGPGPFCAMLLSDMGADVVRIDRPGAPRWIPLDLPTRGRSSIALDLRDPADHATCVAAIGAADVLIEGYRPGVMERLGLGPDAMLARNPRLIFGRMTGWGQQGPLAQTAGHDINYIALTGALAAIGPADRPPPPPLNLVGDFGGGAMYLAFGIAAALYERDRSGLGQVIDAAMIDGAASLMTFFHGLEAGEPGTMKRGQVGLGGARPNYRCYECADGRHVAVGALEPQFHAELLARLDLGDCPPEREEEALAARFRERTRDEWAALFADGDACVSPVLDLTEAPLHPHMAGRGVYAHVDGVTQPAPAPRFSRTPGSIQGGATESGAGGRARLHAWGVL